LDTSGWERAKELFHEAVKRSPEGRRDLLRDERPEVREEVEALLRAHEEAGEPETSRDVEEGPGAVIGRYKILQEIGEGGFGVVYMAEQTEPVRRKVALKIIKLGMDTKEVVARFEAERQALALMDHHNIAKVLDGGATERGRPYFVMELVKGIPVTDYCDQAGLSTVERLELFTDRLPRDPARAPEGHHPPGSEAVERPRHAPRRQAGAHGDRLRDRQGHGSPASPRRRSSRSSARSSGRRSTWPPSRRR
jgi:hypothetical protein